MKKITSLVLILVIAVSMFSTFTIAAAAEETVTTGRVVVFSDDMDSYTVGSSTTGSWTASGGLSKIIDGDNENKYISMYNWGTNGVATTLVNSYLAVGSTFDMYPRFQYPKPFDITEGKTYYINYDFRYVINKSDGVVEPLTSLESSQAFVRFDSNKVNSGIFSGWNGSATEFYKSSSGTLDTATGWRAVNLTLPVSNNIYSADESVVSRTTKDIQVELKSFNQNSSGDVYNIVAGLDEVKNLKSVVSTVTSGSIDEDDSTVTVTVTVSEGGSVTIGDQTVTAGTHILNVASGDQLITLTPDSGYSIIRNTSLIGGKKYNNAKKSNTSSTYGKASVKITYAFSSDVSMNADFVSDDLVNAAISSVQNALYSKDYRINLDNYKIEAAAKLYTDTVKVGANGSVSALTNEFTKETTEIAAGTEGTVQTNNYWGTVYTISPADGCEIASVTYDGEDVSANVADNTFTVAPADVTSGKTLEVEFIRTSGTRTYSFDFSDGWQAPESGNLYQSADGKAYFEKKGTVAADGKSFFLTNNDSSNRPLLKINDFYLACGRTYKISFDMTNHHTSNVSLEYQINTPQESNVFSFKDDLSLSNYRYANAKRYGLNSSSNSIASGTRGTANLSFTVNFMANGYSEDAEYSTYGYYPMEYAFVNNSSTHYPTTSDTTKVPEIHGFSISETVDFHSITADIGEGTMTVTTNSLNFPEENQTNVSVIDGKAIAVEDLMPAEITLSAPAGQVINTAVWKTESGAEVSYPLYGDSTAKITIKPVEESGVLSVTYVDENTEPSVVSGTPVATKNYDYSEFVSDAEPSNTVVMYANIYASSKYSITDCGYTVTNSGGIALDLPASAVPVGKAYGIRAVGSGLEAGTYTVQPYIVIKDGETARTITGDKKTVTVE